MNLDNNIPPTRSKKKREKKTMSTTPNEWKMGRRKVNCPSLINAVFSLMVLCSLQPCVLAQSNRFYNVTVTVTNLAPTGGTCQSPVWIGIHDGSFAFFNRGDAASAALESLAEDGDPLLLMNEFTATPGSVKDVVVGTTEICPGESAEVNFDIRVQRGTVHYLSYASQVLPSNDAFVGTRRRRSTRIFDDRGRFQSVNLVVQGDEVWDAGTEVNDELADNTAFFGQTTANTGVDENGVVAAHPGYNAAGTGGILDDANFANADFTAASYSMMRIRVTADRLTALSGRIRVRNMAPTQGTCQTPVWVGIHDGSFDIYDRNVAASAGLERLAEDGNNSPLMQEFALNSGSLWDNNVGNSELCPGDRASRPFNVRVPSGQPYYLSYASMVIPSNDAFVANGNPTANEIISANAELMEFCINVNGRDVLDAGTEVNDELPDNTNFFGQTVADTGTAESGVVTSHLGFNAVGSGGILDETIFSNADFTATGYQMLRICVVSDADDDDSTSGSGSSSKKSKSSKSSKGKNKSREKRSKSKKSKRRRYR